MPSQLTYLWTEPKVGATYRTAVSLHGHTNHSKEGLYFISEFADRNPVLRTALAIKKSRALKKGGIKVDFYRAHWRPPLHPLAAFQLERDQIERVLGLSALVSLSDHDNIDAPLHLRTLFQTSEIPISVEWSVPYKQTVFHVGIHNLPHDRAQSFMETFAEFTSNPAPSTLCGIFESLHEIRDVLIVLNHPMWDLAGVGRQKHASLVREFIAEVGCFLHAFELGGLRSWQENQRVVDLAEEFGQVLIGGGDRHGAEPSAVLNLTNAESFAEFVREVRHERRTHLLFMTQYSEPFVLRLFQGLLDAIREYPESPEGSRFWQERVFHPDRDGNLRPLAALWQRTPPFIEAFFSFVRLLEVPHIRKAAQMALARPKHKMQFVPGRAQEIASQWTKAYESPSFRTRTTKSTAWRTPAGSLKRSPDGADFLS